MSGNKSINEILRKNGQGNVSDNVNNITRLEMSNSLDTAMSDMFYGFNHRQIYPPMQNNKDQYGYTFFTRPELNLSTNNLMSDRIFIPLLSGDELSIPRYIRCLLDPSLFKKGIKSRLLDNNSPFMNVLSNNLLTISGFTDMALNVYDSPQGIYGEQVSIVDSVSKQYSAYNLSVNFRNIPGDPITTLFGYWEHYQSMVFEGKLDPDLSMIINNTIDYSCRIYRVVLDYSKTRVQKIACANASFPVSNPTGNSVAYEYDKVYNDSNDQIPIDFKCNGFEYGDIILIKEFNMLVEKFNPGMRNDNREKMYYKAPQEVLAIMNNRGYPRIDPNTYEMQWWLPRQPSDSDARAAQAKSVYEAFLAR